MPKNSFTHFIARINLNEIKQNSDFILVNINS